MTLDPVQVQPCEHCGAAHAPEHLYCPATGKLIAARLLPRHSMLEDKYLIGEPIGVGGMGAVFEATHTLLDKKVAIKVMLGQDEEGTRRLIREARAASSTGHPNITAVTDMGRTAQGSLFVVMEYLDGRTIKELTRDGPLPVDLALRLTDQILAGLEAVHRKGIVHRDLKPDNLMVVVDEEGMEVVKILDFGISKLIRDDGSQQALTQTGLVMGTPLYMAPEQARGENTQVGPATDIYAVGAILYAMLTGQPPHVAETLAALISAKLGQKVVPPSQRGVTLPAGTDAVVLRALENDPRRRFADARAMRVEIARLLGAEPGLSPYPSNPSIPIAPRRSSEEQLAGLDALDSIRLDEELVPLDAGTLKDPAPQPATPPRAPARSPADELPAPARTVSPRANVAPPSRGAKTPTAAGRHDPFAPPEDELDAAGGLDLATEPRSYGTRDVSYGKETALPPADAGPFAYRGPARRRSRLPSLAVVLLLALAAGGAYYYFKVLAPAETSAPAVGDEVTVQFITTPQGAEVVVDGYTLTSHELKLRASDRVYRVEVRAPGFEQHSGTFQPRTDLVMRIDLRRPAAGARRRGEAKAKHQGEKR